MAAPLIPIVLGLLAAASAGKSANAQRQAGQETQAKLNLRNSNAASLSEMGMLSPGTPLTVAPPETIVEAQDQRSKARWLRKNKGMSQVEAEAFLKEQREGATGRAAIQAATGGQEPLQDLAGQIDIPVAPQVPKLAPSGADEFTPSTSDQPERFAKRPMMRTGVTITDPETLDHNVTWGVDTEQIEANFNTLFQEELPKLIEENNKLPERHRQSEEALGLGLHHEAVEKLGYYPTAAWMEQNISNAKEVKEADFKLFVQNMITDKGVRFALSIGNGTVENPQYEEGSRALNRRVTETVYRAAREEFHGWTPPGVAALLDKADALVITPQVAERLTDVKNITQADIDRVNAEMQAEEVTQTSKLAQAKVEGTFAGEQTIRDQDIANEIDKMAQLAGAEWDIKNANVSNEARYMTSRKLMEMSSDLQAQERYYDRTIALFKAKITDELQATKYAEWGIEKDKPISSEDRGKYGVPAQFNTWGEAVAGGMRQMSESERGDWESIISAENTITKLLKRADTIFTGGDSAWDRATARASLRWDMIAGNKRGIEARIYMETLKLESRRLLALAGEGGRFTDADVMQAAESVARINFFTMDGVEVVRGKMQDLVDALASMKATKLRPKLINIFGDTEAMGPATPTLTETDIPFDDFLIELNKP